jgi:hypothetical protein
MTFCQLAVLLCFTLFVSKKVDSQPQPLKFDQHAALMATFDALSCNNNTVCPRFGLNDFCQGKAVVCNESNLVSLDIERVALTGTIAAMIGQLTHLTLLRLILSGNANGIRGTIPTQLGQLTMLTRLYVWSQRSPAFN